MSEKPQQEKEIKAVLDRQLSSDRYQRRNTFSQSFEIMQNSKRALWESGNINTQSFKTAEDNKRDHKVGEHKDSKEQYLVIMLTKKNRHQKIAETRSQNGMKI